MINYFLKASVYRRFESYGKASTKGSRTLVFNEKLAFSRNNFSST